MTPPEISVSLDYETWESVLYWLDEGARTSIAAQPKRLADTIRRQIPGDRTMDPLEAASRVLDLTRQIDDSDLAAAFQELAHGLAACERRRRGE